MIKKIKGALTQYLQPNLTPKIGVDGRILPWDYDQTNTNKITGAKDRAGRKGWCVLGNSVDTLTLPSTPAGAAVLVVQRTLDGVTWFENVGIEALYNSGTNQVTFNSGARYKFLRVGQNGDINDVYAIYLFEEEGGLIAYDYSGNGNHANFSNSLYLQFDSVLFSDANDRGFRIVSGVVIPLLEGSTTECADGIAPDYVGAYKPYLQLKNSPKVQVLNNTQKGTAGDQWKVNAPNNGLYQAVGMTFSCTQAGLGYGENDGIPLYLSTGLNPLGAQRVTVDWFNGNLAVLYYAGDKTNTVKRELLGTNFKDGVERRILLVQDYSNVNFGSTSGGSYTTNFYLDGVLIPELSYTATITAIYISTDAVTAIFSFLEFMVGSAYAIHTYASTTPFVDLVATDLSYNLHSSIKGIIPCSDNTGSNLSFIDIGLAVSPSSAFITNPTGNEWDLIQQKYYPLQAIGGTVQGSRYVIGNLDSNLKPTGFDVLGNVINNSNLSGKALRTGFGNEIDVNPEGIPKITQIGYEPDGVENILTIEDLQTWFGAVKGRNEKPDLVNNLLFFNQAPEPLLHLELALSNTLTFPAGSFVANGIVSATNTEGNVALTLGTDSVTVPASIDLYGIRFLDGSGELVEIVPCCEGADVGGSDIVHGVFISGFIGTIGGTINSGTWQTQKRYGYLAAFGGTISGSANIPAKLPLNGLDVLGNSLGVAEVNRVSQQQKGLSLIRKKVKII
jgi:hypothetical protein